jgi:hypothetical protein
VPPESVFLAPLGPGMIIKNLRCPLFVCSQSQAKISILAIFFTEFRDITVNQRKELESSAIALSKALIAQIIIFNCAVALEPKLLWKTHAPADLKYSHPS